MADNDQGIMPYPFMFDQSQWSNKFSPNPDRAIPWPSQYRDSPTDALGRPIQSFQDAQKAHDAWDAAHPPQTAPPVSLNTNPNKYGLQPSDLAAPSALNPSGNLAFGMANWGGMMSPQARDAYKNAQYQNPGGGYTDPALARTSASQGMGGTGMQPSQLFGGNQAAAPQAAGGGGGMTQQQMMASFTPLQQQWWAGAPASERQQAINAYGVGKPAAAQPAAPTNPIDMSQAYLDALSRPGPPQAVGAKVPQSPAPGQQPGVLQQFMANWNKGGKQTTGAGNYNNRGFFDALGMG